MPHNRLISTGFWSYSPGLLLIVFTAYWKFETIMSLPQLSLNGLVDLSMCENSIKLLELVSEPWAMHRWQQRVAGTRATNSA